MKPKKYLVLLLCLLLVQSLFLPVQAAGPVETDREVTLTLDCHEDGVAVTGMAYDLYRIAGLDETGELIPAEPFTQFDVQIRGENPQAWQDLTAALTQFVQQAQPAPTHSGVSGEDGLLVFPAEGETMLQGLYLVIGHRHIQDGRIYETEPFLVLLPGRDSVTDDWVYEVTANPKLRSQSEEIPVKRKVLKIWEDDGFEHLRPVEITVHLLRDGEIYDTVKLTADNGWRHTWENLSPSYEWTIQEEPLEGYTVTVTQDGITFVLTNSYGTPPPPPPDLPQTGLPWWPVPVLLTAGLLCLLVGLIRRRTEA